MIPNLPIQAIRSLCEQHRVRELGLFGSAARGEFDANRSDFDFWVEFLNHEKSDLFDLFGLQDSLENLLHRRVDLVSKRGLKPWIRDEILGESKSIYAAN
ncbi:MAG: nucleotidyltransferase family protein [Candidatus Kapaibacterium sp.]